MLGLIGIGVGIFVAAGSLITIGLGRAAALADHKAADARNARAADEDPPASHG